MDARFLAHVTSELASISQQGLRKQERIIETPQAAVITADGREVINFCANNYLGLAHDARLEAAAQAGLERWGFGLSSVRFICGTQGVHRELESRLSRFLGMESSILYSSCFDANGGLFECLLTEQDAVISDSLNHASIIDGIRLCKAQRFRYANNDMAELERQLHSASACRFKLIATDGVFSMDGTIANLAEVCALADRYQAMVMVDDSHAVGFIGSGGRGTPELCGVASRVDILTGTFGKALGGASGGYVAARQVIVDFLRQRSRPYLFSNSLAPMIAATTIAALDIVEAGDALRTHLQTQTARFRAGLTALGYTVIPGSHPIVPIMLHDATLATTLASGLFSEGIYAVAFSFPVVPMGKSRIRCQVSAAHQASHIDQALRAFATVGRRLKLIPSQ